MLSINEIKYFIEDDKRSKYKAQAIEGHNYYNARHDISEYRIFYYDAKGNLRYDTSKSNVQISHAFFTELVDQQVQYLLSSDSPFVLSKDEDLQKELDLRFNNNQRFISELSDVMTGAIVQGSGYLYAYKDLHKKLKFKNASSLGITEVSAENAQDKKAHIIYYYNDRVMKNKRFVDIKRIQVWDDEQTYFYTDYNGKLEEDKDAEWNPRPHVIYRKSDGDDLYKNSLGYIPFFRLNNNNQRLSGLAPIKGLIDDYDLMACGLSNNIQDLVDGYIVVKGFKGDNLDELTTNLKRKKHIGVAADGDLDIKTVNIPYEARRVKLDLDEKNIYRFGMGFNSAQLGDGNITNVVVKSRYALLDLKCNKFESQLRAFLEQILEVVIDEINAEKETGFTIDDVYFKFEREVMTNAKDNAEIDDIKARTKQTEISILLGLLDTLDDETVVSKICQVLDVDYDEVKSKLPKDDIEDATNLINLGDMINERPTKGSAASGA